MSVGDSGMTEARRGPMDLDGVAWPRHTERLTIRPARADDADAIWAYRRLEEVSRWLTNWIEDRDAWVEFHGHPDRLPGTFVVELGGRVIGDLMVRVENAWAQAEVTGRAKNTQAELGWSFDPGYSGRGYATEAVRELIRICFEDLGLRRVIGNCFADNEPSWRLMERLGMRREAHSVRDSLHRDLGWLDGYTYALLVDEWASGR